MLSTLLTHCEWDAMNFMKLREFKWIILHEMVPFQRFLIRKAEREMGKKIPRSTVLRFAAKDSDENVQCTYRTKSWHIINVSAQ